MPSVHLRSVSFAFTSAVDVLSDVDLDLGPGWHGVVGPNGAGKSTLLTLVSGALRPTGGSVHVVADVPPIFCPQEVGDLTPDVGAFAGRWDAHAQKLQGILGLGPSDLSRWEDLSPGERKRWQVGAALAEEPDILLLDEPTNHLDSAARDVLVAALRRFEGVGLVVSHDRSLLDELTARTLRLVDGGVESWVGGYSEARERWTAAEAATREAYERARGQERRMRRQLADARRNRSAVETSAAAERRHAGHRRPDLRDAARKARTARAEQSIARGVAARRTKVDRATEAVAAFDLRRRKGGDVTVPHADTGSTWLAELDVDEVTAGGTTLLRDVHLAVGRGERIHVAGRNGAGKTTLIQAVLATARLDPDAIAHLPQELSPPSVRELLADTRDLDPKVRGRVLGTLANLGVDPERVLASDDPSPGEARKLALAYALGRPVSLVVLDEPTNHLDLPSIERLEHALLDYPGTLLLVTHDAQLAAGTTDVVWELFEGRVVVSRDA